MSQIFDEKGSLIPVTLIQAGPCPILQKKTVQKNGYNALLLGFDPRPNKGLNKISSPELGLYLQITKALAKKDAKEGAPEENLDNIKVKDLKDKKRKLKLVVDPMRFIKEIKVENPEEFNIGETLDVAIFKEGDVVDIHGISKGRGFAGSIKRFHTHRGPESHGSMYHRRTGSLGQSSAPSRVYKGKPIPGHMGNANVTVSNIKIVKTDKEKNIIFVKGSVPGHSNAYVVINTAIKQLKRKKDKK